MDRIFGPRRTSSKKRDSDGISASSGASRGSDANSGKHKSSGFSLSRLIPGKKKSKSRLSLESEASRSDGGACGAHVSPPHSSGNLACGTSSPQSASNFRHKRRKHSGSMGSPAAEGRGDGAPQTFSSLEGLCRGKALQEREGEGELAAVVTEDSSMTKIPDEEELIECPVCFIEKSKDNFLEVSTCHHRCCTQCLQFYFKIEIMESRPTIACPQCSELYHPNDISTIVQDDNLMQKYESFMLRRVLAMESDTRWCPAPDCGYAVIATGCAGCPKLVCERPGCGTYFCYHCKQHWHPNQTCDAARAERLPVAARSDSLTYSQESSGTGGAQGGKDVIKSCPRCGALIVKMDDLSCNHMICAVCGANFCWLCLKEMSNLHYLSLSGCTFWGRRPWSRKKKILCQLGTLVGAPVWIPLVAGLAVPAIIIGIPIWIGQKIHLRYLMSSKHKRNLAIVSSVAASLLASPIIAGLFVGLGVPALLVYVYGVVPVSLCRSQGCGVTTTNSGVRFEFDEQGEGQAQGPYSSAGDTQSIETAPNVANPSIAPSIGDASLGMTNSLSASGSHIERVGVLRDDSDRDSASHRAIAGNSINGSLCSATYSSQHHKLEVQADILELSVHCEKSSVGGESYSMSLNDDASTRALAGSIVSPKDKDGISLCSRHFDTVGAACPEDQRTETESEPSSSSYSIRHAQQQRAGSPLGPVPTEEPSSLQHGGSHRGKKCTRFMDQVAEIGAGELKGSGGNAAENDAVSDQAQKPAAVIPTHSSSSVASGDGTKVQGSASAASSIVAEAGNNNERKLRANSSSRANSFDVATNSSSRSPATLKPSSSSTSSLSKGSGSSRRGKLSPSPPSSDQQSMAACSCGGPGCSGVRVKAESTSTLLDDGAEWRGTDLASARRKSDSTSSCGPEPLPSHCCSASSERTLSGGSGTNPSGRSRGGGLMLQRCGRGGSVGERSGQYHLSQPSNLWDISELQAAMLPRLQHTAGCSDMLAVVEDGVSCDSVFHKGKSSTTSSLCSHMRSASSAGSFSSEDQGEVCSTCLGVFETLTEGASVVCGGLTQAEGCHREEVGSPSTSQVCLSSSSVSLPNRKSAPCTEEQLESLTDDTRTNKVEFVRHGSGGRLTSGKDRFWHQRRSPPLSALRTAKSWEEAGSLEAVSLLETSRQRADSKPDEAQLKNSQAKSARSSDSGIESSSTAALGLTSQGNCLPDVEMPSPAALLKSSKESTAVGAGGDEDTAVARVSASTLAENKDLAAQSPLLPQAAELVSTQHSTPEDLLAALQIKPGGEDTDRAQVMNSHV